MKKIKYTFLTLFILFNISTSISLDAQSSDEFVPLDLSESLKSRFIAKSISITSMKANFAQEKYISYLSASVQSHGYLSFKKPDKIKWQYSNPYKFTILLNGSNIELIDVDQNFSFKERENVFFKQVGEIISGALSGNLYKDERFNQLLFENSTQFKVVLIPTDEEIKRLVPKLEVFLDKSGLQPTSFKLFESGGDVTTIILNSIELNPIIPDATFVK